VSKKKMLGDFQVRGEDPIPPANGRLPNTIINNNYNYLFWSGEVEREDLAAGLR
jgi:hypothetical protein